MPKLNGPRGGDRHQVIVDFLSNEGPYDVANWIGGGLFIFPTTNDDGDSEMAALLGTQKRGRTRSGGYYPDAVWEFWNSAAGYDFGVAIEVGIYQPDRAPNDIPVIHVGFQGGVSLLNVQSAETFSVLYEVQSILIAIIGELLADPAP